VRVSVGLLLVFALVCGLLPPAQAFTASDHSSSVETLRHGPGGDSPDHQGLSDEHANDNGLEAESESEQSKELETDDSDPLSLPVVALAPPRPESRHAALWARRDGERRGARRLLERPPRA